MSELTEEELLIVAERFYNGLVSSATNGTRMTDEDFKNDRQILMNSSIKRLVPRFVQTCRTVADFWTYIKGLDSQFDNGLWAGRRKHIKAEFENLFLELENPTPQIKKEITRVKEKFGSRYINGQIELMDSNIETHPYDSIGKAKELIESCCIEILTQLGEDITKYKEDMTKLATHTLEALNLRANKVDDAKKGANEIKRILGGLNQIAVGIAELRNSYGSGHGKDKNFTGLTPRHARLAVGSAANLVNFLWETYELQKEKK